MSNISPNDPCICSSGKKYKKCCRPYHNGMSIPSPEALVRARFSAYALGMVDFIMLTTHPESRHYEGNAKRWRAALNGYVLRTVFLNLEILSAEDEKVSYRMKYFTMLNREEEETIEHCTFKQESGKWLYFDGVHETPADEEE